MDHPYQLASYASLPEQSRGRLYDEDECHTRTAFQRDRDRIIHSAAFRRLEYKTQVFVNHEGDHFRTRLTHSLEVSQLARSLCRVLGANEDLAEALALAHDLGHTPFGHAGEEGLHEAMQPYGGFDHNAQTVRILTQLETKYAEFDGLNLTWETLEGIAKHNGPVASPPRALQAYLERHDLEIHTFASLEAQAAAIADDIAYNNHDMEDGVRAGFFTLEELAALPLLADCLAELGDAYPNLSQRRATHELIRRAINRMVMDVVSETSRRIALHGVQSVDDIRGASELMVDFSEPMHQVNRAIKTFLMERMYRHYRVNRMTSKARRVVKDLFEFFMAEPNCLPPRWRDAGESEDIQQRAVTVCDFIAGMTDRFALEEHDRLFNMQVRT